MSRYKPIGWKYEGYRHLLAARGIRTAFSKRLSEEERLNRVMTKLAYKEGRSKEREEARGIKYYMRINARKDKLGKRETLVAPIAQVKDEEEDWLTALRRRRVEEKEERLRKMAEIRAQELKQESLERYIKRLGDVHDKETDEVRDIASKRLNETREILKQLKEVHVDINQLIEEADDEEDEENESL